MWKITASVSGHTPSEISWDISFFLDRGGCVQGIVINGKYRPSPIPKGGLQTLLGVTINIDDENSDIYIV